MQQDNSHLSLNMLNHYDKLVEQGAIKQDTKQKEILKLLATLKQQLDNYYRDNIYLRSVNMFRKMFKEASNLKGVYIYGEVGRGKSMLIDLFFEHVAFKQKRRVHFHAFMQEIHRELFKLRKEVKGSDSGDPLVRIAKNIARDTKLLCLDEMQITDIGDAMIVNRLFTSLILHNVVVVTTSNIRPDELYKDGLQREHLLPFIALLNSHLDVVSLDAKQDYRLLHFKSLREFFITPLGTKANKKLQQFFDELTNNAKPQKTTLNVNGRKLVLHKTHLDIAYVSFAEICEAALGPQDFIEIAKEFSTIIMHDIPKLDREKRNEAKRFINLIDELYEHKVKFICSSAVAIDQLCDEGDSAFAFKRTISRLKEMQTDKYLAMRHGG